MRVLAIGDIHGCSRALDHIIASIGLRSSDLIVTLGDYVDRGPDSCGVIERLTRLREKFKLVPLLGNHEQLMLEARKGPDRFAEWVHSGGQATLASYMPPKRPQGTLRDVPKAHWDFLENACVEWHQTDTHIFVHAGLDPDMPVDQQKEIDLRWERFRNPPPHSSGKVVICGHTPQRHGSPRNLGHSICIDTAAFTSKGWLTCLEVTTGYLWQASQKGQLRTGWLNDFPNVPNAVE